MLRLYVRYAVACPRVRRVVRSWDRGPPVRMEGYPRPALGHPLLRHEEESIPPYTILYDNPTWCSGLAVPERDYYTSSAGSGDVASTETPDPPPWWARN